MRRLLALVLVVVAAAPSSAQDEPMVRDIGPLVGFRQHESSWAAAVADVNGDGWDDVLIVHHGSRPSELFVAEVDDGVATGFEIQATFVDTIHDRPDRHGCAFGDVNVDGLLDLICLKGANQGISDKWNELWIQGPAGEWTDEAKAWGVEDIWGRGRHPIFLDLNSDRYPDLFLGNEIPRHDEHTTPNRTYVNDRGVRFDEVDLGVTQEVGADCVQAADVDGDGRDDLLLCGKDEVFLYLRRDEGFALVNEAYGVPGVPGAVAGRLVDVSGDDVLDLVLVHPAALEVRLGGTEGVFGEPVFTRELVHGHGMTVGDVDGDGAQDLYVVEGCEDRVNVQDVLLLNSGDGRAWRELALPALPEGELAGCGDTAAMIDFDHDGMMDIVVLNGGGPSQPLDLDGPDQLLTLGDWELPV